MRARPRLLGLVVCPLVLCACGAERPGVTYDALRSANVESEHVPGGRLTLADGAFETTSGDDASGRVRAVVRGEALGDVDGDGVTDGVLVLATNAGGSIFMDLVLLVDRAGQPIHAATATLGDGVQLSGVSVEESGVVRVDLREHAEGDPATAPSLRSVRRFAFDSGRLVAR